MEKIEHIKNVLIFIGVLMIIGSIYKPKKK